MNRLIVTLILLTISGKNLYAGTGDHGGDAVVCFNETSTRELVRQRVLENARNPDVSNPSPLLGIEDKAIESIKLLDIDEAEEGELRSFEGMTKEEILNDISKSILTKSTFWDYVQLTASHRMPKWKHSEYGITEVRDSRHGKVFSPKCIVLQIARQVKINRKKYQVYVDSNLYNRPMFSERDKAALLIHEVLYNYYIAGDKNRKIPERENVTSSQPVRELVRYFFSKHMLKDDQSDFREEILLLDENYFWISRFTSLKRFSLPYYRRFSLLGDCVGGFYGDTNPRTNINRFSISFCESSPRLEVFNKVIKLKLNSNQRINYFDKERAGFHFFKTNNESDLSAFVKNATKLGNLYLKENNKLEVWSKRHGPVLETKISYNTNWDNIKIPKNTTIIVRNNIRNNKINYHLGHYPWFKFSLVIENRRKKFENPFFDENNKLIKATALETFQYSNVICLKSETNFYRSGLVRTCYPGNDVTVGRVTCLNDKKSSGHPPIEFYKNGKIKSCFGEKKRAIW